MSAVQAVLQIIGSIWNGLFGLESPFFGLTFKQIFIGLFVVIISIRVLWDLLGLGAAAIDTTTYIGRRVASRSRRNKQSAETRAYRNKQIEIQQERNSIMRNRKK